MKTDEAERVRDDGVSTVAIDDNDDDDDNHGIIDDNDDDDDRKDNLDIIINDDDDDDRPSEFREPAFHGSGAATRRVFFSPGMRVA